jgi:hypothetical protein
MITHKALLAAAMALLVTSASAQTPTAPSSQQLTNKEKGGYATKNPSKRNGDENKQAKQRARSRSQSHFYLKYEPDARRRR